MGSKSKSHFTSEVLRERKKNDDWIQNKYEEIVTIVDSKHDILILKLILTSYRFQNTAHVDLKFNPDMTSAL